MLKNIWKRCIALLLVLLIGTGCAFAPWEESAQAAAADGMIRVLLTRVGTTRTNLSMTTSCAYAIGSVDGDMIPKGATVKVLLSGGSLYLSVNGVSMNMGSSISLFRLDKGSVGVKFTSPSLANIYCGDMIFTISGGAIQPVTRIYIEDYLYGVVAYEMSNSFPVEALKAQAVCARTYAMRLKKSGGTYDVTDNTTHQVYKGYNASYKNVIDAVDATKGQCLTYGGSYAGCWYTASNGGQTESTKNIWGGAVAYSTVKDDPYDLANPSSTEKRYSVSKKGSIDGKLLPLLKSGIAQQMGKLGLSASSGEITIEEVVSIEGRAPKYPAPSRTFTMLRFGIKASSVNEKGERVSAPEVLYADIETYGKLSELLSLDIGSTSAETVYIEDKGDTFDIVFRRYGHGVGLSQRGAQQMAKENGMTCAQILAFYFEGTTLTTKNLADTTAQRAPEQSGDSEYSTLSYGDSGEDVKRLQAKLKELGYFDGELGGNYLTKTTEAVKAYQRAEGLEADGVATAQLQERLFAEDASAPTPAPTQAPTSAPDETQLKPGDVMANPLPGSRLIVYSKPNTSSAMKGTLKSGDIVRLHATSGDWAAVSGSGIKGYVNKAFLAPVPQQEPTPAPTATPAPTPQPTAEPETGGELRAGANAKVEIPQGMALRVYKKPSLSAGRAGALKSGAIVRVHGLNSAWAAVTGEGIKGYVNRNYLRPTDAQAVQPSPAPTVAPTAAPTAAPQPDDDGETAWNAYAKVNIPSTGRLGLRIQPQQDASCIAYLKNATKLRVYARAGDWARVSTGTKMGYVPVKYLRLYE